MGVEPVTLIIGLSILAGGAVVTYYNECERENERRRRQEENNRRRRREERRREKEAKRQREEEDSRRRANEISWRQEDERTYTRSDSSDSLSDYDCFQTSRDYYRPQTSYYDCFQTSTDYYRPQTSYYDFDREFSYYGRYNIEEDRSCKCSSCRPEPVPPASIQCDCSSCNPYSNKGSVTVTVKLPQTTQNKTQNGKNQKPSEQSSSSNSKGTTSGNVSKQNTNGAPKDSNSGSEQPQRNNNNNNNNNNDKKDDVEDYGQLNDFIQILKAILESCKASEALRKKILTFFKKFEKHEENFLRLLKDFEYNDIDIKDILSIVIQLFQRDYFAQDISYQNLLALMEIVAKYLKDELDMVMTKDCIEGSKIPFKKHLEECMKKVTQRFNIVSEIMFIFVKVRNEIDEDNSLRPLDPDFSGIFKKVYHYWKHKVVGGKEWTVKEYFDKIRELLILLKNLNPEYDELKNVNHSRREIVLEVYSTVYQGYFIIVVRVFGPIISICSCYLKKWRDKKAKDGDKKVDGKKKEEKKK